MANNKKPPLDGSLYSPWQVLDSANAYYEFSTIFTAKIPATLDGPTERMDLAAASATNRMLALELYLKAFLIAAAVRVPQEHDLKNLFDALPENNRKEIKQYFDEKIKAAPQLTVPWDLIMYFRLDSTPIEDAALAKAERSRVRSDASLSGLLVRNRRGFVASRYLFQDTKRGDVKCFVYEHRRLAILCRIICEALELSIPGQQPGYKRHFQF